MIEYYTFKHRGDALDYTDEIFLRLVPDLTVAIFYGSKISSAPKSQALLFSEILNSEEGSKSIDYLASVFEECLDEGSEYLILKVLKNGVECFRRGEVYAKIIKDGQILLLPNGFFGMSPDDRIVSHIHADQNATGIARTIKYGVRASKNAKQDNYSAVVIKMNRSFV